MNSIKNLGKLVYPYINGLSRVTIGNKQEKFIKDIQLGDLLKTPYGIAKVRGIIRKEIPHGFIELAELNKMLIIPNHPIQIYEEWTKPNDVTKINFVKCDCLYGLILDKHHVITVNGNNVLTFGRGMEEEVFEHTRKDTEELFWKLEGIYDFKTSELP